MQWGGCLKDLLPQPLTMELVLPQLCSRITEQTPTASPSSPHQDPGNAYQQHRPLPLAEGREPPSPFCSFRSPLNPRFHRFTPSEAPQKLSDACARRPSASQVQGKQDLSSCACPAGAARAPLPCHTPSVLPKSSPHTAHGPAVCLPKHDTVWGP